MIKRPTSINGSVHKATVNQTGEAAPTPRQVAIYRMARVCLIEWADLYSVMLEERRHNWELHPERAAWVTGEVARLQEQLQALRVCDQETNAQIVKDYKVFMNEASVEPTPR
jgi:hypothetical protein